MDGIQEGISAIVENLIEGLKDLFIPTKNPFDELKEVFYSKMPIIEKLESFKDEAFPNEEKKPTFEIDLGGWCGASGTVSVLDFSWYEPYRETVKGILAAFLWVFTLIKAYKLLPSVIGGIGQ